jgi:hypothetical protein
MPFRTRSGESSFASFLSRKEAAKNKRTKKKRLLAADAQSP